MTDLLRRHLRHKLEQLFDSHRVVVWEDDSGALEKALREVLPAGVEMPEFKGNPLSIRAAMDLGDAWLEKRWLLYVPPLPEGVDAEWLTDCIQAFQHAPKANLAWALEEFFGLPASQHLRNSLRGPAAVKLVDEFSRHFGDSVERLREEAVALALLRIALGTTTPDPGPIVVRYLTSEGDRARLQDAGLLPLLTVVIKDKEGLALRRHLSDGQAPDRAVLARCLAAASLVEAKAAEAKALSNHLPDPAARARWVQVLEQGLADSGTRSRLNKAIEGELTGSGMFDEIMDLAALAHVPALRVFDEVLARRLLAEKPSQEAGDPAWWRRLAEIAVARQCQAGLDAETRRGWAQVAAAARLLELVNQRGQALATYPQECFDRLAQEYAEAAGGDWQIEALFRQVAQDDGLAWLDLRESLLEPARRAYHRWVGEVARRFVQALEAKGRYAAEGMRSQLRFWADWVDVPGRVAVLIVDALRADLSYALAERARAAGHATEAQAVLGVLPARTEVGMAALLPRAQDSFSLAVEQGRLVPSIGDSRLPGVTERTRFLERVAREQGRVVERRPVEEFLASRSAALKQAYRDRKVPVAHTTDVDDGGEIAAKVSFELFDKILDTCARFVDAALEAGFTEVVVAGDHGFIVRDPEAASGGVPGTESAGGGWARGLRYGAGKPPAGVELAQLHASSLGWTGCDVFVPRGPQCLAMPGGAGLFVHGGLSPQESVLVFLRIRPATPTAEMPDVSLEAAQGVSGLTFKIAVLAASVSRPMLAAGRVIRVTLEDAAGKAVWEASLDVKPAPAAQRFALTVTARRGGLHSLSLYDAGEPSPFLKQPVKIEVLGDDFGF